MVLLLLKANQVNLLYPTSIHSNLCLLFIELADLSQNYIRNETHEGLNPNQAVDLVHLTVRGLSRLLIVGTLRYSPSQQCPKWL